MIRLPFEATPGFYLRISSKQVKSTGKGPKKCRYRSAKLVANWSASGYLKGESQGLKDRQKCSRFCQLPAVWKNRAWRNRSSAHLESEDHMRNHSRSRGETHGETRVERNDFRSAAELHRQWLALLFEHAREAAGVASHHWRKPFLVQLGLELLVGSTTTLRYSECFSFWGSFSSPIDDQFPPHCSTT